MPDQKVALCVVLIVQLEERRVADSNACCAGAQLMGMSGVCGSRGAVCMFGITRISHSRGRRMISL